LIKLDMTALAFQRHAPGDLELLNATIDAGGDIEYKNRDGLAMLVTAIKASNFQVTELLLLKGASPQHYAQGKLPMFHAVESREHSPQLLRLLLDFCTDSTTANGSANMNALHWARPAWSI
jgi:ankyrin repeat protein